MPAEAPAELAGPLRAFAREHPRDSLYARLALVIAERPAVLELLQAAPPARRWPTLLFAALHDRLLALRDGGAGLPALAAYYPSLGGSRQPDAALGSALEAFVAEQAEPLRETVATRTTQTNEVGRSAVLWPALAEIARSQGDRPLALFDFGCSAGLNLSVDAMHVAYRQADGSPWFDAGAADGESPVLVCRLLADPPPTSAWRIACRMGVDRAPVALNDEPALRWLRACLWPGETARAERFERALALARAANHEVRAADDGLAVLAAWLRELPAGVTPVLFNSWVLAYFTADELAAHTRRVQALVREHGLVWLSAEDDERLAATTGLLAEPARHPTAHGTPTHWSVTWRDGSEEVRSRLVARSHAHGEWLEWLAPR
ncbi:DUF2332 domain-containing protein [Ideonella sp. YS5]|uniref:DUF2332 domain-containing protein n=1 Tax=Ideonella sp. YS5 TaxID=3453714 RepID=UPI003EEA0154